MKKAFEHLEWNHVSYWIPMINQKSKSHWETERSLKLTKTGNLVRDFHWESTQKSHAGHSLVAAQEADSVQSRGDKIFWFSKPIFTSFLMRILISECLQIKDLRKSVKSVKEAFQTNSHQTVHVSGELLAQLMGKFKSLVKQFPTTLYIKRFHGRQCQHSYDDKNFNVLPLM